MLQICLIAVHLILLINGIKSEDIHCDSVLSATAPDSSNCSLRLYDKSDVVECISRMSNLSQYQGRTLHFAFVGDSRMRQQFYSFTQRFPNNDVQWDGEPSRRYIKHYDMAATIPLLQTRITYLWRPKIEEDLLGSLANWTAAENDPTFLLLGVGPHHLIKDADPKEFENQLLGLKWAISKMENRTRVVWFYQVPVIEKYASINARETQVHSAKLDSYARMAHRILGGSSVVIWDNVIPLAADYIRSCRFNHRADKFWYYRCFDYIHTGFVSIHFSSELLINFLCNKIIE